MTILVGFDFADIDIAPVDDLWNSGEEIPVVLIDGDANKNSRADEDLDLFDPNVALVPALSTGDPFTLGEGSNSTKAFYANVTGITEGVAGIVVNRTISEPNNGVVNATTSVDNFSQIGRIQANGTGGAKSLSIIKPLWQT